MAQLTRPLPKEQLQVLPGYQGLKPKESYPDYDTYFAEVRKNTLNLPDRYRPFGRPFNSTLRNANITPDLYRSKLSITPPTPPAGVSNPFMAEMLWSALFFMPQLFNGDYVTLVNAPTNRVIIPRVEEQMVAQPDACVMTPDGGTTLTEQIWHLCSYRTTSEVCLKDLVGTNYQDAWIADHWQMYRELSTNAQDIIFQRQLMALNAAMTGLWLRGVGTAKYTVTTPINPTYGLCNTVFGILQAPGSGRIQAGTGALTDANIVAAVDDLIYARPPELQQLGMRNQVLLMNPNNVTMLLRQWQTLYPALALQINGDTPEFNGLRIVGDVGMPADNMLLTYYGIGEPGTGAGGNNLFALVSGQTMDEGMYSEQIPGTKNTRFNSTLVLGAGVQEPNKVVTWGI